MVTAGLFAYHRLWLYDVYAGSRDTVKGIEGFFFTPDETSPWFVLVLAATFLYIRRERFRRAMVSVRSPIATALGIGFALLSSLLCLWASYVDTLGLLIPSMSLMLVGGGLYLGGWDGLRAIRLPALFLVLAFPHPAVLLNAVIYPMQLVTAQGSTWILDLVRLNARQSGDLIFASGGKVFEVIETCAGLRSAETLVMASMVYTQIFSRDGLRAILLIVLAPLVGLGVNFLRVVSIVLNPESSLSGVHTAQGIVMLVGGVLLLDVLDRVLGRILPGQRPRASVGHPTPSGAGSDPKSTVGRAVAFFCLLSALGCASAALPPWKARPGSVTPIYGIAAKLDGWTAEGLPLDKQFMGTVGFSEWLHRRYSKDGGPRSVVVFIGTDNRLEPRVSLISPKTAVTGPGDVVVDRSELGDGSQRIDRILIHSPQGSTLAYHWSSGVGSLVRESIRSALALDRGLFRRPGRSIVVRVSVRLPRDRSAWPAAERDLGEVARPLIRQINRIEGS